MCQTVRSSSKLTITGTITVTIEISTKQRVGKGILKVWPYNLILGLIDKERGLLIISSWASLAGLDLKGFQCASAEIPVPPSQTETYESFGPRGQLPASIQTGQSIVIHFFYPLSKCCLLNHWAVRWKVTLIATPSFFSWTTLSSPAYHILIYLPYFSVLSLSFSIDGALAYWSARRRDR